MELLSPAGNYQAAFSAFNAGSDAIYVGGKSFSARMSAENFSDEEMIKIIHYAHLINKKVYVTMNTLIYQDEFIKAKEYCEFLYRNNVDALIIQDLGLAYYLHQVYPDLVLHASTQVNCHTVSQAKALKQLGFKRIILSREADITLAKQIQDLGLEVEVFVHGALCVSYSGNCLMSSFIGSRSGNRGRCAQPCRLEYTLCTDKEDIMTNFAISTKDLNTLSKIDELVKLGIDSIKIEGRLKQDEYVYLVIKAYRNAIDKHQTLNDDQKAMQQIFSREFTSGYLFNESPFNLLNQNSSSHQGEKIGYIKRVKGDQVDIYLIKNVHRLDGIRVMDKYQYGRQIQKMFVNGNEVEEAQKGKIITLTHFNSPVELNADVNRTSSYKLLKKALEESKKTYKKALFGKIIAKKNQPLSFEISGDFKVKETSEIVSQAKNCPTSQERIIEQFNKTGEYPFYFEKIIFIGDDDIFVSIKDINSLRNKVLLRYVSKVNKENTFSKKDYKCERIVPLSNQTSLKAICLTNMQENICQKEEIEVFSYNKKNLENRIGESEFIIERKIVHMPLKGNNLIASPYCNITNSYALDAYYSLGFDECILSSELDFASIKLLLDDYYQRNNCCPQVGLMIYGRYDVMVMKSCPIGTYYKNKHLHCQKCHQQQYYLKDRLKEKFPLIGDSHCQMRILDYKALYIIDQEQKLMNISLKSFYLNFTLEDEENTKLIIKNAKKNLKETNSIFNKNYSTRHFFKRAL